MDLADFLIIQSDKILKDQSIQQAMAGYEELRKWEEQIGTILGCILLI